MNRRIFLGWAAITAMSVTSAKRERIYGENKSPVKVGDPDRVSDLMNFKIHHVTDDGLFFHVPLKEAYIDKNGILFRSIAFQPNKPLNVRGAMILDPQGRLFAKKEYPNNQVMLQIDELHLTYTINFGRMD